MNTFTLILDFVLILIALVIIAQFATLAWVKRKSRSAIRSRYSPQDIIMQSLVANSFGQTSKGLSQVRGNGALVLTKDEIWFRLALPARELTIPLKSITSISIKESHLKKKKARPLLYIEFNSLWGIDSAAWMVKGPEEWKRAIEAAHS